MSVPLCMSEAPNGSHWIELRCWWAECFTEAVGPCGFPDGSGFQRVPSFPGLWPVRRSSRSGLCFSCHIFLLGHSGSRVLLLEGPWWGHWTQPDNPGWSPHLLILHLLTSIKSLFAIGGNLVKVSRDYNTHIFRGGCYSARHMAHAQTACCNVRMPTDVWGHRCHPSGGPVPGTQSRDHFTCRPRKGISFNLCIEYHEGLIAFHLFSFEHLHVEDLTFSFHYLLAGCPWGPGSSRRPLFPTASTPDIRAAATTYRLCQSVASHWIISMQTILRRR